MTRFAVVLLLVGLTASSVLGVENPPTPAAGRPKPEVDRDRLPVALRNVPLRRLSSGLLSLLDRDGDLVTANPARALRPNAAIDATTSFAVDPRIAGNLRLGDDPVALPANQRAQAEPHIVRSPVNADFLAATFQEGRFATNGGALDCGYSISRDGGLSWTRALIPGLTQSSGGPYFRATDPVAAIDGSGRIFLNTLTAVDANGFDVGADVVVSRSTDLGQSFGPPVVVYRPRPRP